jgi:hypothetical protein
MKYLAALAFVAITNVVACGDDDASTVYFNAGATSTPETFFDFPLPADIRLDVSGAPDLAAFPNPRGVPILADLLALVPDRRGWPVMATGYFRFTAPIPDRSLDIVYNAGAIRLVDIDPDSAERGRQFPVVMRTLPRDAYTPEHLIAVAPRPGIVLQPSTTYAYVVLRELAPGFEPPAAFTALSGTSGNIALVASYQPLWPALELAGIARADVLVATVFTTGDELARVRARSEAIRTAHEPALANVTLVGGDTYDGFCHVSAQITLPQFQTGVAPFASGGKFVLDASDVPVQQGELTVPVVITLPRQPMPATGWPLYHFFHGSGGISTGIVDLGRAPTSADMPEPGKGPGYVVARHGIAAASGALPVNPERLPGASDYEYLNINNLAAFPQTFQQGLYEQRLLLDALLASRIPDATVADCTGISSPSSEHFFDPAQLTAGGQSMGGMYTNLIAAVEPRYGALVPTGAGGFWNLMILEATLIPGARNLLAAALGVDDEELSFVHPAMNLMPLAWETGEPIAAMARLGDRPLPGMPVRHIYQPVGKDDENFPLPVFDAAALAYGNEQAGAQIWPSMQSALSLAGLSGVRSYPVSGNRDGFTRVVVQFEGDGIIDSHYIYRQLETVKHQYGCFLATYVRDGVPTVPAPNGLFHPCP